MQKRNPIAVALLPFITFGIYSIYWMVKTKGEMNSLGAKIPTAWLIIVPLVNIWWVWKYSEGVEQVTGGKLSGVLAFVLLWLLGSIGGAIVQDSFNSVTAVASATAAGGSPLSESPTTIPVPAPAETAPTTPPLTPIDVPPVANPTPPAEMPPSNNAQ